VSGYVTDRFPELGPDYGRATNDPLWDCIHLLAPGERKTTLCGRGVDEVAHATSLDSGYKPNPFEGCWTCLEKSNRWAKQ
jgi:hypothetical protein